MINNPIQTISAFSSEEEYRAFPAIHYSQLAAYFREDVLGLYKEVVPSDAMKFGSLVDALCTRYDEMHNIYAVAQSTMPGASEKALTEQMAAAHWQETLAEIPRDSIIEDANIFGYRTSWKDDTRYNKILSECSEYYRWYKNNSEKILITEDELLRAKLVYDAIFNHPYIRRALSLCDTDDYGIEYQVKLKTEDGYKCMLDAVFIDYTTKTLYPIDLKTTSDDECLFPKSILKWQYWIQAQLYTDVLNDNLLEYDLMDWRVSDEFFFVVANRDNPNPMIYRFDTSAIGRFPYPNYKDIAKEVKRYLSQPERRTPFGMSRTCSNKVTSELITAQNPHAFTQWNRKHQIQGL